jgi:transcriptional regulator with XRE-family HTH domain
MVVGKGPGGPRRGPRRKVTPNHSGARLKWIRIDAQWHPGKLATLVRQAGRDLGKPNDCNSQMVRDWEDGALIDCDPLYHDALAKVTGLRFDLLCSPWVKFPATPEVAAVIAGEVEMPELPGVPYRILLRQWRLRKHLSQSALADLIQRYGESIGEPNACTKRLVQKWESGEHATVNANYVRILNKLTGIPADALNPHRASPLPNTALVPPDSVLELIDIFLTMLNELRIHVITRHAQDAASVDRDLLEGVDCGE